MTLLLLDCYLSDSECPHNFVPLGIEYVRIRAAHVDPGTIPVETTGYDGIVITGSAASVLEERPWSLAIEELIHNAYASTVPLFGVCFGHQLIAKALFNATIRAEQPEIGWYDIWLTRAGRAPGSPTANLPGNFRCFLSHYDVVRDPEVPHFERLASSRATAVQAFRVTDAPICGVQFHAEFAIGEALELFDIRTNKTPDVVANISAMRSQAVDGQVLWTALYGDFLARLPHA